MTWSTERIEQARTLWLAGNSASIVAEQLGDVTRNSIIGLAYRQKWRKRETLSRRPHSQPQWLTAEHEAELRRLHASGLSTSAIASVLGISQSTVSKYSRKLGLSFRIGRPRGSGKWRPIETAPDWSGSILVWIPDQHGGFQAVAQKDDTDYWIYGPEPGRTFTPIDAPLFWMPLPKPPGAA